MRLKISLNYKNIINILSKTVFIVSICVFVFSLIVISKKLYAYYHDDTQYQKVREQVASNDLEGKFPQVINSSQTSKTQIGEDPVETKPYTVVYGNIGELDENNILSDYSALKRQNNDLVGWIQMPGFKKVVDYPVMQATDNNYYLNHDFYKNESQAGSIFMDSRNNSSEVDRHIILYGHSMKNMSMFGNLKEFPNKPSDHIKNTRIYLDLLNTRLEYEVFAAYYENESYNYRQTSFSSDYEFRNFINRICSKSVYNYKIKLTEHDKIITLSTCNDNLGSKNRSVTHARLIRQIVYDRSAESQSGGAVSDHFSKTVVSANVYLKKLVLEYGDTAHPFKALLSPAFARGIREFAAQLPSEVESVRLSIEKADPKSTIEVTLNEQKTDLNQLMLKYGENIIKIKIISRDKKYTRTLTVIATRTPVVKPSASPDAPVSSPDPSEASPAGTSIPVPAPTPEATVEEPPEIFLDSE